MARGNDIRNSYPRLYAKLKYETNNIGRGRTMDQNK